MLYFLNLDWILPASAYDLRIFFVLFPCDEPYMSL